MLEAKRALPFILLHFIVGFAGCLLFSYIKPVSFELLSTFLAGYRFRAGILLFITFMPALQISGLLIGYALAFSKNASDNVDRWSAQLLSYLKGAFIICLCCISVYVVLSEGVSPFLEAQQDQAVERTGDYNDFISVAQDSLERGFREDAKFQTARALQIWPKSKDALKMLDAIQLEIAEFEGTSPPSPESKTNSNTETNPGTTPGMTVRSALDKALEAEKNSEFYNAHYFAMLAWGLAPGTDPNKSEAMIIASRAWNQITKGTDLLRAEEDKQLYRMKYSGYVAIQSKDYLKAYYIFLSLHEEELKKRNNKIDPDIERFLEVSRKGVLEKFFFIDETLNMRVFESARDVFFVIKRSDGSVNSVFIRGVTYSRASGKDMAFLRDFEYARFDRNNVLQYQIAVPYAKMYPYTDVDGQVKPELMLNAVNRNIQGANILPAVITGKVPEMEQNILQLDMSYSDFNLLVTANKGASSMSLIDLFRFMEKAEKYGFSRTECLREMIDRLADPFLMLIISIYALTLGWKYRLGKNVLFKAWWILTIPLFPLLSLFIIGVVRYLSRICSIIFVGLVPQNPVLLMLIFLALCFTGMSVFFFSQRSD